MKNLGILLVGDSGGRVHDEDKVDFGDGQVARGIGGHGGGGHGQGCRRLGGS